MKNEEKSKAIELRSQGLSIKDIAKTLGVAKSSVSIWVRDVVLSEHQRAFLDNKVGMNAHVGLKVFKEKSKTRRDGWEAEGFLKAKNNAEFAFVCGLYWGEGDKTDRNSFKFTNADCDMIRLVIKWLKDNNQKIAFRVQYYGENGLSEAEIAEWWCKHAFIELSHLRKFTRCTINRASQRKRIGKLPYGTATIESHSTELKSKVMGGIRYLRTMGD